MVESVAKYIIDYSCDKGKTVSTTDRALGGSI